MSEYRFWPGVTGAQLSTLTDEDVERAVAEIRAVKEHNERVYLERKATLERLKELARQLFKGSSRELKYISKLRVSQPWGTDESDFRRKVTQARESALREKDAKQADAERLEQTVRAVKWLEIQGKVAGKDFEICCALETANELAYELEAARLTAMGGMHSFEGEDMCEKCIGWDGASRRCECGNRRVCWTRGYGHSFERPNVIAGAY